VFFHQASWHLLSASFKVTGWSQKVLHMQQAQSQYPNFLRRVALNKKRALLILGKVNIKMELINSNITHHIRSNNHSNSQRY